MSSARAARSRRHVNANYEAGPLDFRFADRWDSLSGWRRWWEALSGGVGPAPPLAAGVLAQAALCVLLATARHPAFAGRSTREPV